MKQNSHSWSSRTGWTILIVVFVLALLLGGCGPSEPKVYRVGILALDAFATMVDGFKARMTELGYVEGENITYDIAMHNIDLEAMQATLDKFVADKVDLIFVLGTPSAIMAKKTGEAAGIPVVFASAAVEGTGLIESVQQPGGNTTGVRFPGTDVTLKRLEFLLEIAPQVKRIWLTYESTNQSALGALEALRPVASSTGITLVEVPVSSVAGIEADLQAREQLEDIGFDAILILPEGLSQSQQGWPLISDFAAKHNIPVGGSAAFEADQGAIFSYIPDNVETGRLAAPLADKIFRGTQAGTIPVVSPESLLRLNSKTIEGLGLTVPEGLAQMADEVIR